MEVNISRITAWSYYEYELGLHRVVRAHIHRFSELTCVHLALNPVVVMGRGGGGGGHISVPAGICGKNPRKLAQEIAAENNKKCGEKCGTCQELAELLAENCGFGPNHEICCILRIAICVLCK